MGKYICSICGYVYDESIGTPDLGVESGTLFKDIPEDWKCPWCGASTASFNPDADNVSEDVAVVTDNSEINLGVVKEYGDYSLAEISVVCSNLAKASEKQYLSEEAQLFSEIASYFDAKAGVDLENDFDTLSELLSQDMNVFYPEAFKVAIEAGDRGAHRTLKWSEKVTMMLKSVVDRSKKGEDLLSETKVYVCDICGFVYIGDEVPDVCPVCKVPSMKISEIGRRAI